MKKTFMQKKETVKRDWYLVDLEGATLGRVATRIARILIGKNKASYTPHIDVGDFVVVINSDKLVMSGDKMSDKKYYSHSGRPDGFKEISAEALMTKDSRKVVLHAVKGMVPKNKLASPRLRRLKIYTGSDHPHTNHEFVKES